MNVKITKTQITLWLYLLLAYTVYAQQPGALDTSFISGSGTDDIIWSSAQQTDNKTIIAGAFTTYNGVTRNRITRVNADGSLDTTFNTGTGADNRIISVALQSDGKILIAGWFTSYNGVSRNRIARLNTDGSLDTTFNPGSGADGNLIAVVLQSDGKILISGVLTHYNGVAINYIARLNTNGSLDTTFTPAANNYVNKLVVQPDGKILIGGLFTAYGGVNRNLIARLNTNGSLDTTFNPGTGATTSASISINLGVESITLQPDNKILIGGNFTHFNGTSRAGIARLNTNGSLDSTFNPGTGIAYQSTAPSVKHMTLQPDSKIFIGGTFSVYNGVSRQGIARLNSNGSLDSTFNPGTGIDENKFITSINLQSEGKALITGNFYTYNGTDVSGIARIYSEANTCTTPAPTASTPQAFCNGGTVANLTATGTAIQWYSTATGGTSLASGTQLINATYYATQTLNGCESPRVAVAVSLSPAAPAAVSQAFCSGATIANLSATGSGIKWYLGTVGGTPLASTVVLTTRNYYATQTVNGCESTTRTLVAVTITTTAMPVIAAQTFCNGGTVAGLTATGTAIKWYSSATGGAPLASQTALATGTYYATQTLNGCESARRAITITVNITPAPAASAQTFCNGATVANLAATGTTIKWYTAASGGTVLARSAVLTTNTYYVTQTLNNCESPRMAVAITVNTTPAPAASAQTHCNGTTVASLIASGSGIKWYLGATGVTPLAPTAILTTRNYYASQTLNGCEGARTTVAVTINTTPLPTAPAQRFCNGGTVAGLVATGTAIQWYSASTGGTPLSAQTAVVTGTYYATQTLNGCESARRAVTVTVNYTPAPTAAAQTFCNSATVASLVASGTTIKWYTSDTDTAVLARSTAITTGTYYATQTLNGCESPRTAVAVTVNVTPAPVSSAQTFCSGATIASLTATGTAIKWYSASAGGAPLTASTVLTTRNYYASQTLNGCEGPRTTVAVTVITTVPPTAASQSFCSSGTVANLTATGTAIQWYTTASGGTALSPETTLATGTYYATQTLNGCESTRRAVSITVTNTPAPAASAQTFCSGATVANLAATGNAIKWYLTATGGLQLPVSVQLSTSLYYASQTINGCESPRTQVSVTVNTTPEPLTQAQTYCQGATVANLAATGTNIQWYTTATGGTPLTASTVLTTNTYYASQTLNGCQSARASVAITIQQPVTPIVNVTSSDLSYNEESAFYYVCGGSPVTFEAHTTSSGANTTYEWYVNGELQQGETASLYATVLPSTGALFVSVKAFLGADVCSPQQTVDSEEILISLIDAPYVEIIPQGPTTFCQGGSVVLQAAGVENYDGVWLRNGSFYDYVFAGYNDFLEVTQPGVYTLEVSSSEGCAGASAPVTLIEATPVTPAVSLSASVSGPIASGTPVTFTANPTHGGTAPQYDFKVNGTTMQSGTSATYTTSTLANGNVVTVQLTSNAMCATAAIAISNGITMIINAPGTVTPEPGAGGILYVIKGENGTGTSWADALGEVADALKYAKQANEAAAGSVSQIWVAGGVYVPLYNAATLNSDNGRNSAFVLVEGVQLYGGFAGNETGPQERNLTNSENASVLSGDLLQNDNGTANTTENAYHVVIAAGSTASPITVATALDGFTITRGTGNVSGAVTVNGVGISNANGGGIYNINASPTLKNLIITGNRVITNGGGVYNAASAPVLVNVLFTGNTAANGAGIYNNGSPAILTNVTIAGNTATSNSGAIYNISSSPLVRNTIIYGNSSGVLNSSGSSVPQYAYSLVQGINSTANHNVPGTSNPMFTNAAAGDYTFQIMSPALNSGNNTYYAVGQTPNLNAVTIDLAGGQRIYNGGTVDMGAYEFQQDCSIATTWNGSSWSNGTPTSYIYTATITGNYNGEGSIAACSLTVTSGSVVIATGQTFDIKGTVNIQDGASLAIEDNAALVQRDNLQNSDAITLVKNSNALYRLDYTIWASPVAGQNLRSFSPQTLTDRFYEYKFGYDLPSNSNREQYFLVDPSTTNFEAAKGYLIRMPNGSTVPGYNSGATAISFEGIFTGIPNNGLIERRASVEGDRYTAVGNPYPSPISVADFFKANDAVIDETSALYFWRKRNNAISSSYATLTLIGYTANQGPGGGSEQAAFYTGDNSNWLVAQGQGFLVRTKPTPTGTNITFANSMRRAVPATGGQAFFRTAAPTAIQQPSITGVSRYWINLTGGQDSFSQTMVGYSNNATTGLDYGYDGKTLNDTKTTTLYSLAENTPLAIQARPNFTITDVVPMGFTAAIAGSYTISQDHMDGVFEEGQQVYLKDNLLGITHNLNDGKYEFRTEEGTFNDRFEIVYTTAEALSSTNPVLTPDNVVVFKESNVITVNTSTATMQSITVYDTRGRMLYTKNSINAMQTTISGLQVEQQVIILEINTDKGIISKRIVF